LELPVYVFRDFREIAPYKYPLIIEFRDSLPKGNTGKIQRKELVEEGKARG
jgi:fatty-acyl-CoA synthase/long-chain acyl-CoA synthetase